MSWVVLWISHAFSAPDFSIRHWTTEDGLPQNTVRHLLQTRDGYLWIGTGYGLARFDGVQIKDYTAELMIADPDSIRVEDLAEDRDGTLWIRTAHGFISHRRGRFEHFSILGTPLDGRIQTMRARAEGGLWLGTWDGLKHFENGRVVRVFTKEDGPAGNRVNVIYTEPAGAVWIKCQVGPFEETWFRFDPKTGESKPIEEVLGALGDVLGIHQDRVERWWMSTREALWLRENDQTTRHPTVLSTGVFAEKKDGSLWYHHSTNLVRFQQGAFTTFSLADGLPDTDLRCVRVDREDNVWVGTGSQGLAQLRPRLLTTLLTSNMHGPKNESFSVATGAQGHVWIGTHNGLASRHGGEWGVISNHLTNRHKVIPNTIFPVLEDRAGRVWAGVHGQGLRELRAGRLTPVKLPGASPEHDYTVRALTEDRAGRLWVGTQELGLFCREPGGFRRFTKKDGLPDDFVSSIREAPDGSLWLGTFGGGVAQFRDGRFRVWTTREGLLANRAGIGLIEVDGTVWVGTPHGLNRIRGHEIRAVTAREGLFDNAALSLIDDGLGHYWSHGTRGIWRMRRDDLHAVADGRTNRLDCATYGVADGMASAEGNGECQPGAARLPDGTLWFPTTRGVVTLDPSGLAEQEVAPVTVIEQVQANDVVVLGDGVTATTPGVTWRESQLRISPGRADLLKIRYTANYFAAPERLRFQHRLQGLDQDWRNAGTDERLAVYANLAPGSYVFHVRAGSGRGVWDETGASFAFTILPHFWQTRTFYVLFTTGIGAGALGLHWLRLRRQRRLQSLEHQLAFARERARIAQDIHDDIGASLTRIQLLGQVVEEEISSEGKAAEARAHSQSIAATAREVAQRMDEIVWAVNPGQDTLTAFVDYITHAAQECAQLTPLRCRIEVPSQMEDRPLPAEFRHHLYLIVREALHNAVKHSGASELVLRIRMDGPRMSVEVEDNGRGFDPAVAENGNGLRNLRSRAERIGGECRVSSAPGTGTKLALKVRLP